MTTPKTPKPATPPTPPSETMMIAGTEVMMTIGLLQELERAVGGVERITFLVLDPTLMKTALWILLVPRDEKGRPEVSEEDYVLPNLSAREILPALRWAGDHLLDFFMQGLQLATAMGETYAEPIQALMPKPLMPTSNGSPASEPTS